MYGFLLEMFWSKKEIICFLIAVSVYITNKFGVSRIVYIPFFNNHLNDIVGGYVFATILVITHRFWIKREIKVQIYFLFIILASIYWEYIAPLYLPYSVKDVKDIAAYLAGGWVFWIFIKKKE